MLRLVTRQFCVTRCVDFNSFSKPKATGFQNKYQSPYSYYTVRHSS